MDTGFITMMHKQILFKYWAKRYGTPQKIEVMQLYFLDYPDQIEPSGSTRANSTIVIRPTGQWADLALGR